MADVITRSFRFGSGQSLATKRLLVRSTPKSTLWRKKITPFYFCKQTTLYFHNFWHTDTEVNLKQSCNKIAHLSWRMFAPYLVKRNLSQFVHISSNVRFKSRQLRRNIIANVQRLFLALRHALKQSCHRSVAWSIKLCWLLTTFQSDSASAHRRPSLVSDKRVSVSVGVFRLWCTGVVFMQLGVKVNGVLYITVVCILCVLINDYCDVLLFKQFLPDIYQAAGDFDLISSTSQPKNVITCAQEHWAAATQGSTRHGMASRQTRPQFSIQTTGYKQTFRNAFSRGRQTLSMSCSY